MGFCVGEGSILFMVKACELKMEFLVDEGSIWLKTR
jgi:hypothetical protein